MSNYTDDCLNGIIRDERFLSILRFTEGAYDVGLESIYVAACVLLGGAHVRRDMWLAGLMGSEVRSIAENLIAGFESVDTWNRDNVEQAVSSLGKRPGMSQLDLVLRLIILRGFEALPVAPVAVALGRQEVLRRIRVESDTYFSNSLIG